MNCSDPATAFDNFYSIVLTLLNRFFPLRDVTTTSRDPFFVTPYIKCLLRKKNRLVRAGKQEEADSIALKISKLIIDKNTTSLDDIGIDNASEMWKRVNEISGKQRNSSSQVGQISVTASTLNCHYSKISQDLKYVAPMPKASCIQNSYQDQYIAPFSVFHALDKLKRTASGNDMLPFWFLKATAPFIAEPLSALFSLFEKWVCTTTVENSCHLSRA